MYVPPHFEINDRSAIQDVIEARSFATLVTWTGNELMATPLPLLLCREEGEYGTLYGHVSNANQHWSLPVVGEALAVFAGVDSYITPSWYATKADTGMVVPTWNYETVHAYGLAEFFQDEARLLDVVTRLTEHHEGTREKPWQVSDAPEMFIQGQLRGIVGFRMPISRLQGKRKMNQNRSQQDREGVDAGLRSDGRPDVADLVP